LKIQDKFRVGDTITIRDGLEGVVEKINYLTTTIRRNDNSASIIPNHAFTQGELVNWSRTPFRQFSTQAYLPISKIQSVPIVIEDIQKELMKIPEIESNERDVLVYAKSFDGTRVLIDVDVHFNTKSDTEAAKLQTRVVGVITAVVAGANPSGF